MTVAAYSNINAISPEPPAQSQAPPAKTESQPVDSVHLSAAATAALKSGGDADHDGDSH